MSARFSARSFSPSSLCSFSAVAFSLPTASAAVAPSSARAASAAARAASSSATFALIAFSFDTAVARSAFRAPSACASRSS